MISNVYFASYVTYTVYKVRRSASSPSIPNANPTQTFITLFPLVLSQANDLIQHNVLFRRLNINAEVRSTQRLEAHKRI
jgi:hypothetical protein